MRTSPRRFVMGVAIGVAIGPLLLGFLAGGCKAKAGGDTTAPAAAGGRGGRGMMGDGGIAFAVETLAVEAKRIDYLVMAPGTVEAFERVQVTARVAGAVDRVAFTDGQQVKKGDILVVIDSQRYQLAVNTARVALEKTDLIQKDVEAQLARRQGAIDKNPGLIPGEELETYKTKSLSAKADTASATQTLRVAELNLRDSYVRAPMEGIIQTRTVETGQYVQAGYVMATLIRSEPMLLRFQVEPQEAPRVKPGMMAAFSMRETQRTFSAKVTLVAAAADPTTHMVGVTAEVIPEEHKYWLRPGSFCDVSLDVAASRDAVVIPRPVARATDHGYVVYVVDGDIATERTITLGLTSKDGWVEIRSGLKAGDTIVVKGGDALTSGARVRVPRPDGKGPPGADGTGDSARGEGRGDGSSNADGGRGRFSGDGGRQRGQRDASDQAP